MRRAVRSPVASATTALMSSSVCKLPFIRPSTCPARASATAATAAAWLCSVETISYPLMFNPAALATRWIFAAGPTNIGLMSRWRAASSAPRSDSVSQGWTTAIGSGGRRRLRANSFWKALCCAFKRKVLLDGGRQRAGGGRGSSISAPSAESMSIAERLPSSCRPRPLSFTVFGPISSRWAGRFPL